MAGPHRPPRRRGERRRAGVHGDRRTEVRHGGAVQRRAAASAGGVAAAQGSALLRLLPRPGPGLVPGALPAEARPARGVRGFALLPGPPPGAGPRGGVRPRAEAPGDSARPGRAGALAPRPRDGARLRDAAVGRGARGRGRAPRRQCAGAARAAVLLPLRAPPSQLPRSRPLCAPTGGVAGALRARKPARAAHRGSGGGPRRHAGARIRLSRPAGTPRRVAPVRPAPARRRPRCRLACRSGGPASRRSGRACTTSWTGRDERPRDHA